jgi:hypothetical protein
LSSKEANAALKQPGETDTIGTVKRALNGFYKAA